MKSRSIIKWCALLCALAVTACSSQRPAPVVDRSGRSAAATAPLPVAPAGVRTAKDGIYVAQRGDTVANVALAFGVSPKDLARWNGLGESEGLIPGQTVQVTPPADVATVSPVTRGGQVEVRPLPPGGPAPEAPASLPPGVAPVSPPAVVSPASPAPSEPALPSSASLPWLWPTAGKVI